MSASKKVVGLGREKVELYIFHEVRYNITLASIRDVGVSLIVFQALANVAIGHIGTRAVTADARVVGRRLLAFCRAFGVPNGEIDHVGHAPGELVAGVAVQVRRGEVVP
jgi:hypothetical protein